jgi:hypothetical protein
MIGSTRSLSLNDQMILLQWCCRKKLMTDSTRLPGRRTFKMLGSINLTKAAKSPTWGAGQLFGFSVGIPKPKARIVAWLGHAAICEFQTYQFWRHFPHAMQQLYATEVEVEPNDEILVHRREPRSAIPLARAKVQSAASLPGSLVSVREARDAIHHGKSNSVVFGRLPASMLRQPRHSFLAQISTPLNMQTISERLPRLLHTCRSTAHGPNRSVERGPLGLPRHRHLDCTSIVPVPTKVSQPFQIGNRNSSREVAQSGRSLSAPIHQFSIKACALPLPPLPLLRSKSSCQRNFVGQWSTTHQRVIVEIAWGQEPKASNDNTRGNA